jgi:hypothetical protein
MDLDEAHQEEPAAQEHMLVNVCEHLSFTFLLVSFLVEHSSEIFFVLC